MATPCTGTVTFTVGGSETAAFTWTTLAGAPFTYAAVPAVTGGPTVTITDGNGPVVPYFNGAGAITTTGGTLTMANPCGCTVVVTALG